MIVGKSRNSIQRCNESPLNWSKHQVCEAKKFKCNIYIQTQDTLSMCRCFVIFAVVLTICFIGERAPNNPEFHQEVSKVKPD